jgi:hypothetical protein
MTRKTTRFLTLESTHAHVPLARLPVSIDHDRDLAMARPHRPGPDLESASERRPLIFRGVLLALPVSLVLWWVIGRVMG